MAKHGVQGCFDTKRLPGRRGRRLHRPNWKISFSFEGHYIIFEDAFRSGVQSLQQKCAGIQKQFHSFTYYFKGVFRKNLFFKQITRSYKTKTHPKSCLLPTTSFGTFVK